MNPLKWLINLFPAEKDDSAGWGPFRLPDDCDWLQRAATKHDQDFEEAATDKERLSTVDARLFENWVRAAQAFDPIERCKRYGQICKYWPIARMSGRYFWDN
jgi:hypothetical protein